MTIAQGVILASAGFLLAVLWFDLMFDVQVRGHDGVQLPEPVLDSIAAYYRRVTTTASPMGTLVAITMLTLLIALGVQWFGAGAGRVRVAVTAVFAVGPIALGLLRTFPSAVRLGARSGTHAEQSARARAIYREHLLCVSGIAIFLALQVSAL